MPMCQLAVRVNGGLFFFGGGANTLSKAISLSLGVEPNPFSTACLAVAPGKGAKQMSPGCAAGRLAPAASSAQALCPSAAEVHQ